MCGWNDSWICGLSNWMDREMPGTKKISVWLWDVLSLWYPWYLDRSASGKLKSEEKSVLKLKTFEMNYRCCALEPCLIQMDISGPTGWQAQTGGQLVRCWMLQGKLTRHQKCHSPSPWAEDRRDASCGEGWHEDWPVSCGSAPVPSGA